MYKDYIGLQEDQYIYYEDLGYYSLYNRLSGCQYSVEVIFQYMKMCIILHY